MIGAILLALAGAGALPPAMLPPPLAALFGAAHGVRIDGPDVGLRSDRGGAVRLTPVRYEPAPGRSELVNAYRCGLLVTPGGGRPVALETVGRGETEALSCDGLVAAEAVSGASRIALVYRTRSPNESSRTPIIIRRMGADARWAVDDALSSRLAERLEPVTIAAIRRELARR